MSDILLSDFRGGRNGVDSPASPDFPSNQVVESLNVDFSTARLGSARNGSENLSVLGGTAFSNGVRFLCRHVPSGDEGAAEMWAIDGSGVVKRLAAGTVWADVTLDDPITGDYDKVCAVSFNGKLYLFYKSAQNRLHVYDPLLLKVRRVGIAAPTAAPTAANFGAGAVTGARYFRARFLQLNGLIVIRRSEPGPASTLFTPSGAGSAVRVTAPAAPNEGETHWELEGSLDARTWVTIASSTAGSALSPAAVGSTIDDTSISSTAYPGYPAADSSGMYSLFPAARYGITDNNRLIVTGSYLIASEPKESRIWYSPVLGSDDKGDDERWVNTATQKNRIDTSEKNGGSITSIVGPVNGVFWTMKYRQIWRHTPTGDLITPYLTKQVTAVVGAIDHRGTVLAEDSNGGPVGYFTSHRGPCRISLDGGLAYMGRDIEDIWKGRNGYSAINQSATVPCHVTFHSDECQLYLWIATGVSDLPNLRLRCDIKQAIRADKYGIRGGWMVDTGDAAAAYCSCLFANTPGATMSRDLKPYIGRAASTVWKCDSSTAKDDVGTAYRSYWVSKSIVPPEYMRRKFSVTETIIMADATADVIRQELIGDYGVTRKHSDQALDRKKLETTVVRKFGGSMISEQGAIQIQLGDMVATASDWAVQMLLIPEEGKATA